MPWVLLQTLYCSWSFSLQNDRTDKALQASTHFLQGSCGACIQIINYK